MRKIKICLILLSVLLVSSCDAYISELSEVPEPAAITAFSADPIPVGANPGAVAATRETQPRETAAPRTEPETAVPETEPEPELEHTTVNGTVTWIDADHFEATAGDGGVVTVPFGGGVSAPEYGVMYGAAAEITLDADGGYVSCAVGGVDLADKAYEIMKGMSDEEKVGQLILAGCSDRASALSAVENYHLGGLVLFARDFKNDTKATASAAIKAYQDKARIPLIISADEEGGTVCRVSYYTQYRSSYFLSPRDMYARAGMEGIRSEAVEKARLLLSLGVNMNLAPVADISTDPKDFIYDRSLGQSPEITGEFVKTVVTANREEGLASCLKHFPGYGSASDTHTGIAYDGRSLDDFMSKDFVPFRSGVEAGAGAVMVAHIMCSGIDPDIPACLSEKTHKLLRRELGFTGVCVTDDLGMGAITQYTGGYNAAVTAVLAGNDLLAVAGDYITPYKAVLESLQNGTIPRRMVDGACMRVLMYKLGNGIIGG